MAAQGLLADILLVNRFSRGNGALIGQIRSLPLARCPGNQLVEPFLQRRAVAGALSEVKFVVYLGFGFFEGASLGRIDEVDSRTISSGSNITVSGYASVGF
jgi:hypothetical protein